MKLLSVAESLTGLNCHDPEEQKLGRFSCHGKCPSPYVFFLLLLLILAANLQMELLCYKGKTLADIRIWLTSVLSYYIKELEDG